MLTVVAIVVSNSWSRYFSNFALFIGAPTNSNCIFFFVIIIEIVRVTAS